MAKQYEFSFNLGAALGSSFGKSFSEAETIMAKTQKQIEALYRKQGDIAAFQRQQEQVKKTETQIKSYTTQLANVQKEQAQTGTFSSDLANKEEDLRLKLEDLTHKLDKQNEALSNRKRELKSNGIDTDNLTGETERLNGEIDQLSASVRESEQSLAEMSQSGESGFKTLAEAMEAAGLLKLMERFYRMITDSTAAVGAYADDILTLSAQYGISAEKLQVYKYAADLVDVSVETLTGSMSRQIRSMGSAADGTESYAEAYRRLGVEVTNTDGSLRDGETVYWEVLDALGAMANETERDELAMTLLGRSAMELNPLIKTGSDGMAEYAKQAKAAGYVLSDEVLAAAGAYDDALRIQERNIEAVGNAFGSALAPAMTAIKSVENDLLAGIAKLATDAPWLVRFLTTLTVSLGSLVVIYKVIPTITKTWNALKTISAALTAKDAAASTADAAAKTAEAGATTAATAAQHGLNAAMAANPVGAILIGISAVVSILATFIGTTNSAAQATGEAADASDEYSEQLDRETEALERTRAAAGDLADQYESAYDSARDSMEGQFKLFDQAGEIAWKSVEEIESALETQNAYWNDYGKDLYNLMNRKDIKGLDRLLAAYSDGSKDSVGVIASLANASDADLRKIVESWNKSMETIDAISYISAELSTGFTENLKALGEEGMAALISGMDEERVHASNRVQEIALGLVSDFEKAFSDEITSQTVMDAIRGYYESTLPRRAFS